MAIRSIVGALLLLLGRAAAQDVHVVGPAPGPGIDFLDLASAIAAAADGDTILVLPGEYEGQVLVPNRQLVIAGVTGPAGERAEIRGLSITALAAGRSTVVRGLDVRPFISGPNALTVSECAGAVLLEDCEVVDPLGFQFDAPRIEDSEHVVLTRCTLEGPRGFPTPQSTASPGGAGLQVLSSSVTLYDCTLRGGHGSDAEFLFTLHPPATVGGPGVRVTGGTLFVAGSTLTGGEGGAAVALGSSGSCLPPANGGEGLVLDGVLRRLDTSLSGGAAGLANGCAATAVAGLDLVVLGGSVTTIPQTLRRLVLSSPVEAGGVVSIDLSGAPSEPVILLQALAPLGQWKGGLKGTLAGAPPYLVFPLGPLGPDGKLHLEAPVPAGVLPAGVEALLIVDQLASAAAGGGGVLSSPSTLVLVDDVP